MASVTYSPEFEQPPRVVVAAALSRLGAMSAIGVYLAVLSVTPLAIVLAVGAAVAYAAEVRWRVPLDEVRTAERDAVWFAAVAVLAATLWPLGWWVAAGEVGGLPRHILVAVVAGWAAGLVFLAGMPRVLRRSGMTWSDLRERLPQAIVRLLTNFLAMLGIWYLIVTLH